MRQILHYSLMLGPIGLVVIETVGSTGMALTYRQF
jgi:uncharacterized iron-regulated membrane protein